MRRSFPWLLLAVLLLSVGVAAIAAGLHLGGGLIVLLSASPLVVGLGAGFAVRTQRR